MARMLKLTARGLGLLVLVALLGALFMLTLLPKLVDGAALTVTSGSMSPNIPVGSVVVIRPVDTGTLKVGDIITFQRRPGVAEYVTHRIAEVNGGTNASFTTKGDANRGPDLDKVPSGAVRGQVWFHTPYLGYLRNVVGNRALVLPVAVAGLLGYALWQGLSALKDRKRERQGSDQREGVPASA